MYHFHIVSCCAGGSKALSMDDYNITQWSMVGRYIPWWQFQINNTFIKTDKSASC